jgi:hypothetical protein
MQPEGWDPGPGREEPDPVIGSSQEDGRRRMDSDRWWLRNRSLRFYGFVLLAGTKLADAVLTAVGIYYVPGVVELNPLAKAAFADHGTLTGLAVLSFATVAVATILAELLAVEIRRRLAMDRLALIAKGAVYGSLSLLFGWIAIENALLLSEQVQVYVGEVLFATGVGT